MGVMAVEFSLLIALAALVALVLVVGQLRGLAPRIAALREELAGPPQVRELRYTITEVIVRRTGNVVALPVRQARALPQSPLRAIALNEAA